MGPTGFVLIAAGALLPILWLQGRRDEAVTARRWCFVLSHWARQEHDRLRQELDERLLGADATYAAAAELSGEARRELLDLSLRRLAATAPGFIALLRMMLDVARRVAALAPPSPLRPAHFEHGRTWRLAALHTVLDAFLVGSRERYSFRLYVLARGFRSLAAFLGRRVGRTESPSTHTAWRDYHRLSDEALDSYRLLLVSLEASPAGAAA